MAYKKSTDTSTLKDILAKLSGDTVTYKPVVFCTADVSRAKTVLDRLLSQAANCELDSIEPISRKVEEA